MIVRVIRSWRKPNVAVISTNDKPEKTYKNNNDKDKKLRVVVFNDSDRKWATSGGGKR